MPRRRDRPSCSAGRAARVASIRAWPRCASGCLAGRSSLRPGTRFRWACLWLPAGAPGPGCRESFFKSLLRLRIGVGMLRAHRQAAVAELCQIAANRALVHLDAKAGLQFPPRSIRRQRTTPWMAGSGPSSTSAEKACRTSGVSGLLLLFVRRSRKPVTPSAL